MDILISVSVDDVASHCDYGVGSVTTVGSESLQIFMFCVFLPCLSG